MPEYPPPLSPHALAWLGGSGNLVSYLILHAIAAEPTVIFFFIIINFVFVTIVLVELSTPFSLESSGCTSRTSGGGVRGGGGGTYEFLFVFGSTMLNLYAIFC